MSSPGNGKPTPALDELRELMGVHFIEHFDASKMAHFVIDVYRVKHTTSDNAELRQWVEQLALEMLDLRKPRA
jgi:hypothetical protein